MIDFLLEIQLKAKPTELDILFIQKPEIELYLKGNEYEFIAIWGDADNYNQVVWVQLQKDGSQRTDGFYPGMRVMVYGQISLDQGCTDDVSDGMVCFPAVIGSSVAER